MEPTELTKVILVLCVRRDKREGGGLRLDTTNALALSIGVSMCVGLEDRWFVNGRLAFMHLSSSRICTIDELDSLLNWPCVGPWMIDNGLKRL